MATTAPPDFVTLFKSAQDHLKATTGMLAADVYLHLISLPGYSTSPQRQALMRRIQEALFKSVPIIGVAHPWEAIMCIDTVTLPPDKDTSFFREHWKNDEANHERGTQWLRKLYLENFDPINEMFKTQRDFGWVSSEITYGLYLSDHTILNGTESKLVVLSGMIAQNLPRMTAWHLRIERVVEFAGVKLEPLPRVKDIEHEV
ncbi:hypothetical protein BU23DRAFT_581833 [Bimuria novae-zelandiae CBS 107.79]|uniref:Uncharacterized protein n=1 Tax=Bimuria novae-zelandiae CBS 107.79 TaxID=1447943 RepID=A0A6A5V238_9PLEO|nr:hypothetical protein BU23DRAFT_581833 [Bimuria novae-zelandiae CBS 107.79]